MYLSHSLYRKDIVLDHFVDQCRFHPCREHRTCCCTPYSVFSLDFLMKLNTSLFRAFFFNSFPIVHLSCVLRKTHTLIIQLILTWRTLWTAFVSNLILSWMTCEAETTEDCHHYYLNRNKRFLHLVTFCYCTL